MKVLRLVMTSFGNQRNKIIDFSDNVNLIMGTNDTTLQTVRTFLDGMLFGLSPEDKKRYRPRKLPFSGVMYLEEDSGKRIKVERNFLNSQFSVTDTDGNDVTDDYSDEYGDFTILPVADSIFSKEPFSVPDATLREKKKLTDLKAKRRSLVNRYNYEDMLAQRNELVRLLNEQKKVEEELEQNNSLISENEEKIQNLNRSKSEKSTKIDEQIKDLENQYTSMTLEIEELKEKTTREGAGKAQVLLRNVQGTDEQIQLIDKRITELKQQEATYTQKLTKLEEQFTINREELKKDYENYQRDIKAENGIIPEPLVEKMAKLNIWIYAVLIVLGIAGVGYVLYNPNDLLTKVPIFLISFISAFVILISIFGIYLKSIMDSEKTPKAIPIEHIRANEIVKKYHQNSGKEFIEFYNDAKKIFVHIDNLKVDIKDIQKEIGESEADKERLIQEQQETKQDLEDNQETYQDQSIQNKIIELTRERNKIETQIEELKEEKSVVEEDSIWRLKEEAIKLAEENKKLKNNVSKGNSAIDEFYKLQKRIDRYESKLSDLDRQIKEIEDNLNNQRKTYILNYANPNESDFDEKMARQFNFGLQRNMKKGSNIPYITFNPFVTAGGSDEELIQKLKKFINNKQVLVFSTELDEEEIFKTNNIKHNGIYIAESRKAS